MESGGVESGSRGALRWVVVAQFFREASRCQPSGIRRYQGVRATKLSSLRSRLARTIVFSGLLATCAALGAETKPVLGPGATRDEVIDTYGWPNGQSQSGDREIFSYQQGRVVLKDGVVERMDFSPKIAWPVPKPRPKASTAAQTRILAPEKALVIDLWITDFAQAMEDAKTRDQRILALFTGTDWSPASKRFQDEIAVHPEFVNTVGHEYVLLRLDYPRSSTQDSALREQNATLRERFAVTAYPSAILLTSDGREFSRVDLAKARPQSTYREQVIAAIQEANPTPVAAAWLASAAGPVETTPSAPAPVAPTDPRRKAGVLLAVAAILLTVAWVWRKRARDERAAVQQVVVIPTVGEIAAWSQGRLREVCAKLFRAEGSRVDERPSESGADLAVFGVGEKAGAKLLIRCLSGANGPGDLSSTRDFLGTMIAEGVQAGWYVAPAGFGPEAREFAHAQGIGLIVAEDLRLRLEALPAAAITGVLVTGA